ncbi:MAG TPA: glycosyltransferase family 39 protein, partial [Anaerolineae bacterium]|nr:glycosyltransferase family 39 protein [Anaerolineae bacterium]
MNTHQRWIILPIFFLAVALRLSTITTKSLWVDEVNSLQQASWTRDVILSNPYHDPHPPGYYLFLHEWIQRFGTSELWLRLPSAIFGALSVLVVYALGRSIGSPRLGAWAAFLLAIDPIGIWYSQETRMYAMLAFFALCGTLVTALMLKRSTIWAWPIAVLTFAAAMYLDYGGLIFWGVSIVVTIIAMIWLRAWKPARFALWLTAQVAIALLYLPQWPKAFDTISSLAQGYIFQLIAEGLQRLGLKIDQQNLPIILIAVGAVMGLAFLIIFIRFMRHRTGSGTSSNRDNRLIIIAILIAYVAWLLLAAAPRFYSIKR